MAASISTTGRGDKVPLPGGKKHGLHVGTLNGVQWVAWNGQKEFREMCANFDKEAARILMKERDDAKAKRKARKDEPEINKIDRKWPKA